MMGSNQAQDKEHHFDGVHMKHRSDPTIIAGACELRPGGPLAGGDGVLIGSQ